MGRAKRQRNPARLRNDAAFSADCKKIQRPLRRQAQGTLCSFLPVREKQASMAAVAAVTAVLVLAAGRPVRMIVMAALHVGIILQRSCKQSRRRFVRAAGHAAVELNPRLCQRILCACADAAADEYMYAVGCEEARQCAVAAALGIRDLFPDDPVFLHVVELELRRVAKVLEYVSVFICYRNSHCYRPFLFAPSILRFSVPVNRPLCRQV